MVARGAPGKRAGADAARAFPALAALFFRCGRPRNSPPTSLNQALSFGNYFLNKITYFFGTPEEGVLYGNEPGQG
jgi:hypothetical protein